jgi:hypothetical protein
VFTTMPVPVRSHDAIARNDMSLKWNDVAYAVRLHGMVRRSSKHKRDDDQITPRARTRSEPAAAGRLHGKL